jgi:hypothetical protein
MQLVSCNSIETAPVDANLPTGRASKLNRFLSAPLESRMGLDGATYTNTTGIFATWLLQRIQYCSKMLQDVSLFKLVCNYYATSNTCCTNGPQTLCNQLCRSNWNDNCFCPTEKESLIVFNGSTYTNNTSRSTHFAAATYSVTVKNAADVSLLLLGNY